MAWIRHERRVPDEVVLLHMDRTAAHSMVVEKGIRKVLAHYGGGEVPVRRVGVAENAFSTWKSTIDDILGRQNGSWVVDVTPSRTVPKLAAVEAFKQDGHEVLYLDVEGYRYEAKPFQWIPYNLQTIRFLKREETSHKYRRIQPLGPPPGVPEMGRIQGVTRPTIDSYETVLPWEALVVLLNEAGASKKHRDGLGVQRFEIKVPHLGLSVATYDLETRRFRLSPYSDIMKGLRDAQSRLDPIWQEEVPRDEYILQSLASARLLPFKDQERFERLMHEVALQTRGPNPGMPLSAFALDTNLFYLDFFTAVAHAAGVPMPRIPVVASSVSLDEIRYRMDSRFVDGDLPRPLDQAGLFHPFKARAAHSAHEEFEMLRTRCRMHVVQRGQATGGADAGDQNDATILEDLAYHQGWEGQRLLVLSNDRGFIERGREVAPGVECVHVDYADPRESVASEADIDQVAYLIHRLALGFGRVSLKGLECEVYGDYSPDETDHFLHEQVRIRVPDKPWSRGFLHEVGQRKALLEVVKEARVWL